MVWAARLRDLMPPKEGEDPETTRWRADRINETVMAELIGRLIITCGRFDDKLQSLCDHLALEARAAKATGRLPPVEEVPKQFARRLKFVRSKLVDLAIEQHHLVAFDICCETVRAVFEFRDDIAHRSARWSYGGHEPDNVIVLTGQKKLSFGPRDAGEFKVTIVTAQEYYLAVDDFALLIERLRQAGDEVIFIGHSVDRRNGFNEGFFRERDEAMKALGANFKRNLTDFERQQIAAGKKARSIKA